MLHNQFNVCVFCRIIVIDFVVFLELVDKLWWPEIVHMLVST